MKQAGHKQSAIASAIEKDKSVVSRELKRNADGRSGKYGSDLAERKYRSRQAKKTKKKLYTPEVKAMVEGLLLLKYSPVQIVGHAGLKGLPCVSHERIYQDIWADKKRGGQMYLDLRSQGKRYRKRGASKDSRGIIKDRVGIADRPAVVGERARFGDLEIDTVIGKNHKGALLTINDRATGMVKIRKLEGKNAAQLASKAVEALREWKPFLHTITSDNGKEFAEHAFISAELGVGFFFARPYHSWERGSNENLNGLIRQYIPKKTDFSSIDDQYVAFVEKQLNERPRKRFEFLSPLDIFNLKKVAFVT